jgi:diketogulonate reductase-like aldo/keto reductase
MITDRSVSAFKVGIQFYRNEDTLGAAIKASGKPREYLFVTTKLSSSLGPGETVSDALRKSLARLGLGAL